MWWNNLLMEMYEAFSFSGFMFRLSFGADVLLPSKIAVSSVEMITTRLGLFLVNDLAISIRINLSSFNTKQLESAHSFHTKLCLH